MNSHSLSLQSVGVIFIYKMMEGRRMDTFPVKAGFVTKREATLPADDTRIWRELGTPRREPCRIFIVIHEEGYAGGIHRPHVLGINI